MNIGNAVYGLLGAGALVFLLGGSYCMRIAAISKIDTSHIVHITRVKQSVCLRFSSYGTFPMDS